MRSRTLGCCLFLCFPWQAWAQAPKESTFRLDSSSGLEVLNMKAEAATFRGRRCVHLIDQPHAQPLAAEGHAIAILIGSDFEDGTIEVDLAGAPREGAFAAARGFIGLA